MEQNRRNLALDLGNTFAKAGIFEQDELLSTYRYHSHQVLKLVEFLQEHRFDRIILSSVIDTPVGFLEMLKEHSGFLINLDPETPLPVKNEYHSASTLGNDRRALACGARLKFPKDPVLAIDAGSCITYDVVNEAGTYLGGAISPGLHLRYRTLNDHTANLPLLDPVPDIPLTGTDTHSSIHSGVVNGLVNELDGMINAYRAEFPGLQVVVSGGDASFFVNKLKNRIFAEPNLVLLGLNQILNFNA